MDLATIAELRRLWDRYVNATDDVAISLAVTRLSDVLVWGALFPELLDLAERALRADDRAAERWTAEIGSPMTDAEFAELGRQMFPPSMDADPPHVRGGGT